MERCAACGLDVAESDVTVAESRTRHGTVKRSYHRTCAIQRQARWRRIAVIGALGLWAGAAFVWTYDTRGALLLGLLGVVFAFKATSLFTVR